MRGIGSNKWPNSIAISEWFFKPLQPSTSGKRRRLSERHDDITATTGVAAAGGGSSASVSAAAPMDDDDDDGEQTIPLETTLVDLQANDGSI